MDETERKLAELRVNLVRELFQAALSDHADAEANFASLDTKAQNTAAIGGVFLAGTLALFNSGSLQKLLEGGSNKTLIFLAVTGLLILSAAILAILAMRLRDVPVGDMAISKEEIDEILLQPTDELPDRYERYLLGQVKLRTDITAKLREANLSKSRFVYCGQLGLAAATVAVGSLLMYTLYNASR